MRASFMADNNCYARKLSELLQEQQEPFLLRRRPAVDMRRAFGTLFCGRAVRSVLLAGCFSCGTRRMTTRAGDIRNCHDVDTEFDAKGDGARQISPVSVLELLSVVSDDEESCIAGDWEEDETPSTSPSSPPSHPELFLGATIPCFPFYDDDGGDKICKMETGEDKTAIVSSWDWERIAGDVSRIPMLVHLALSSVPQEWMRFREDEACHVGASIEAMIFEEMRAEAVRDMLA